MIKYIYQKVTGKNWGKYPGIYTEEAFTLDCAVFVFGFLIFFRWWPL